MDIFAKGENIQILEGLKLPVTEKVSSLSEGWVFLNERDSQWNFIARCNITTLETLYGTVVEAHVTQNRNDDTKFDYDITLRVADEIDRRSRVILKRVLFTSTTPLSTLIQHLDT